MCLFVIRDLPLVPATFQPPEMRLNAMVRAIARTHMKPSTRRRAVVNLLLRSHDRLVPIPDVRVKCSSVTTLNFCKTISQRIK